MLRLSKIRSHLTYWHPSSLIEPVAWPLSNILMAPSEGLTRKAESEERPPWERADDHFLMYFCSLLVPLEGFWNHDQLEKNSNQDFYGNFCRLLLFTQKKRHMKKSLKALRLLPNFAQSDLGVLFWFPQVMALDLCFKRVFSLWILPLWKCITIKSPSRYAGFPWRVDFREASPPKLSAGRTKKRDKVSCEEFGHRCLKGWMYSQTEVFRHPP